MRLIRYPLGLTCKENSWNEFQKRSKGQFENATKAAAAYSHLKSGNFSAMAKMMDFSSQKDKAIFWSGAMTEPQEYADSIGGVTLEMTKGGQVFDGWSLPGKLFPAWFADENNPIGQRELWESISAEFGKGATGDVIAIQAEGKDLTGTIWQDIEEPILMEKMKSGEVTSITAKKVKVKK